MSWRTALRLPFKATAGIRFMTKIASTEPGKCWLWMGAKVKGYGSFRFGKRAVLAHRFSYERFVGPIPDELTIDHLCRNRACVNPLHMEVVTMHENWRRGESVSAKCARQTHCLRGHELSGNNIVISRGARVCKQCKRASEKQSKAAKQLAGLCVSCSNHRGSNGTTRYCRPCADRHAIYQLRHLRRKRFAEEHV